MDKIKQFFSQKDKLQHVVFSMVLTLVFTALFSINFYFKPSLLIAGGVALFCGIGKEVYDSINDKVASWLDILADLVGVLFVVIPLILI